MAIKFYGMNLIRNASSLHFSLSLGLLAMINVLLVLTFGYLTLNHNATFESRAAAAALAFFIPMFIVYNTNRMSGWERCLKFGSGLLFYLVYAHINLGVEIPVVDMLSPVLILALVTLGLGQYLINSKRK